MFSQFRKIGSDITRCISPEICYGCGAALVQTDHFACPLCLDRLPITNFHFLKENPFIDKFFGRIPIFSAGAMLYYSKDGIAKRLIHDLKYRNRPNLGEHLGKHYGFALRQSELFNSINVVVPVPLHKKRMASRGYNQSETFARGLSKTLMVPVRNDCVIRSRPTKTQTRKTRIERFENVSGAFQVVRPEQLKDQHILLVDDVLTSGATLEGCAQSLISIPGVTLSMATIGFAFFQ